ncbi:MAG: CehA/McbA family metallohydrolase [Chloroflexota bacterium]|nr:CehA/McbA family metallohydrolase [Chloroflexota bacterium]
MHNLPLDNLTGRADLHMHTNLSDGAATVSEMLHHVEHHTALDVIAITDHDRIDASLWAYEHRARYRFEIVPGLEVTTRAGHVLALWVTQLIPPHMTLVETVNAIHDLGGIAVIAHPFEPFIDPTAAWRYLSHPSVLRDSGIDAIEIFNAGSFTPGSNALAKLVLSGCGAALLGNSDAHMPDSIGSGFTRFRGKTAADLRDSIAQSCTAAEGVRWPITTYFKLLHTAIQWKRNRSSRARLPSARPTTP